MIKTISWLIIVGVFSSLNAFEKLPDDYQVSWGKPEAPLHVTEYFSLSCPKCHQAFKEEFAKIKETYIDSTQVFWTFHLHPADLITLQAMACLHRLSPAEKQIFWEVVLDHWERPSPSEACALMKVTMEALGKPFPSLQGVDLENHPSFQAAYRYLKQPGIVQELPTIEINGTLYEEFPCLPFLEEQFAKLLTLQKFPSSEHFVQPSSPRIPS